MRVELAGSIAVGKTTLCDFLKRKGWNVVSENLSENPYKDKTWPEGSGIRGYCVQMAFLVSKASEIERQAAKPGNTVYDYSLLTEYAYAEKHLGNDRQMLTAVNEHVGLLRSRLPASDLVIFLECPADAQFARIQDRMRREGNRDFEKSLTVSYLSDLNRRIAGFVNMHELEGGNVLRVDTSAVDLRDEAQLESLLKRIEEKVRKPSSDPNAHLRLRHG